MKLFDKKPKDQNPLNPLSSSDTVPSQRAEETNVHEQSLTPSPSLEVRGELAVSDLSSILMEYQMTVSPKVQLSQKDASILLMICNVTVVTQGIDFTLYLTMEWLYNFLLKGYKHPLEYPYEKGKQGLILAELILIATRGAWLSLGEFEALPKEVEDEILSTGWLPNQSTLRSWMQYRSPKKYFRIRAVRLDTFLENERNSERYSSYTKGYGEGGKLARVQRTPFSAELDGVTTGEDSKWEFSLLEISTYNTILNLIEKWKSGKIKSEE